MLLQIDGWYGAGKSVLLGLLDGHPDVSPSPLHDATHMCALNENAVEACAYHDLEEVRRLIATTQYYLFEKHGRSGLGYVGFGAGIVLKPEFKFDFYAFDKAWIDEFMQLENWTPELLVNTIHKNYALHLTGKSGQKYHLSMSWPVKAMQQHFVTNFKTAKSIFVERSIEQIIAVRSGREKKENTNDTFFAPGFDKLIKDGEVRKILEYNTFIAEMVQQHPDRFMSVKLEDLIYNRKPSMQAIAQFLDIPFTESLLEWTWNGEDVKHNGVGYVDDLHDKPEEILSAAQLKIIQDEIKKEQGGFSIPTIPSLVRKTGTVLHRIAKKLEK